MTNQQNNYDDSSQQINEEFMIVSDDRAESKQWNAFNKKKEKKRKLKKALLITLISICAVVIVFVSAFFILSEIGKNKLLNDNVNINAENSDAIIYEDSTILYKDVLYGYNENITGILFMGVDREELTESESRGNNGQADTIMLVTVDTQTGKTVITGIPRDTIAEVDIYSTSGIFLQTDKTQICLSYAYGDGKTLSCENTVKAVCELLYGMPINTYLSADYSLVSKLTETLGGVSVIPNESFEAVRPHYATRYKFDKGVTTTLDDKNVLPYLKHRGNEADSSYLRMERQMGYLQSLVAKASDKTKSDLRFPVSLYNMFSKNTISNLTTDKITYITTSIFNNRNDTDFQFKKLEGKQIIGKDGYAEFHPDETKLFELVLELFYQPLG